MFSCWGRLRAITDLGRGGSSSRVNLGGASTITRTFVSFSVLPIAVLKNMYFPQSSPFTPSQDRLARQKAAKKLQQQPAPAIPSAEAEELPTPVTPPSLRPPVPSSPAPMPPASPSRAPHPPPPPTADAPHPATPATSSAPPAPEGSAPRAADLAKCMDTAAAAAPDEVETSGSTVVPASPTESAPVPTGLTKKGATAATVDAVADGVAALSVKGEGKGGVQSGGSGAAASVSPEKQPTSPSKFGSPGRHKAPSTKSEFCRVFTNAYCSSWGWKRVVGTGTRICRL